MNADTFDRLLNGWGLEQGGTRGILIIFGVVLMTAILSFVVSRVMIHIERQVSRSKNHWDDALFRAGRRPLMGFVWLQGVFWAAEVAQHYSGADIFGVNKPILSVGVIWLLAWATIAFVREAEKILVSADKLRQPMDYTTVSAIGKLLRAVVIITAVLIIMQSLGYSISGLLAFGGIGGIAVGFAAKDLLANFFGSLMIYLDRPFKVGDWIRSPDKNIEGTVENIGWRLTTIRTFDKRPLYVPNATFASISVENPSRMSNRRIFETIGIRYGDIGKMEAIVDQVKKMLRAHDEIDCHQTLIVNFNAFNASSIDFFIYTFTKTTDWVRFHAIKQDVLLRVSEIITGHQAEIAFPTRTLHVSDVLRVDSAALSMQAVGKI